MSSVFDPNKCPGLENVTPVDDSVPFISDLSIPNPPNPIRGCQFVPLPVVPPPVTPPPPGGGGGGGSECPTLLPSSQSQPVYFAGTNVGQLDYGFVLSPGDDCTWTLGIDLQSPCPVLQPDSESKVIPWSTTGQGYLTYGFTLGSDCTWTLDIDVTAPCPVLQPDSESKVIPWSDTGQGYLTYGFTLGSDCTWTLDIDATAPCPVLQPESESKVIPWSDTGQGYLTYGFTLGSNCTWTLSIDAAAPCPTLQPDYVQKPILWSPNPAQGYLTYGFTLTSYCSWALNIDATVPCPTLQPSSQSKVIPWSTTGQGYLTYGFTLGANCTWTLNIDATAPCPTLQPDFVQKVIPWSPNPAQGYLTYGFTLNSYCVWTLDINVQAPCPILLPPSHSESVKFAVGNTGVLNYAFLLSPQCTWLLDIDLLVPCPDIGPLNQTTKYVKFHGKDAGAGLGDFYYHFSKTNNNGECAYDLVISTIQIPCPIIEQEIGSTVVIYDPCDVAPSLNISIAYENDDPNTCGKFSWFYTLRIPDPEDCCVSCLSRLCVVKDASGNVKDIYYRHPNPWFGLIQVPVCSGSGGGGGGSGGSGGGSGGSGGGSGGSGGGGGCCPPEGSEYVLEYDITFLGVRCTGTTSPETWFMGAIYWYFILTPCLPCEDSVTFICDGNGNLTVGFGMWCAPDFCGLSTNDFDIIVNGCPGLPTFYLTIKPGRCASGSFILRPA
jgi:hypothetical protein